MIVILYDVENMLKIVFCKMYLKYLTDGRERQEEVQDFLNKIYVISH